MIADFSPKSLEGSASNDMSWVTAGVLLLVISVVCTWDFLWCLDMNLATYGALFHGTFVCRKRKLEDPESVVD
jgi:hypothetical protein